MQSSRAAVTSSSDTAGAMGYQYAESGKLRESFALEDDEQHRDGAQLVDSDRHVGAHDQVRDGHQASYAPRSARRAR